MDSDSENSSVQSLFGDDDDNHHLHVSDSDEESDIEVIRSDQEDNTSSSSDSDDDIAPPIGLNNNSNGNASNPDNESTSSNGDMDTSGQMKGSRCHTDTKLDKVTHTWSISNFSSYQKGMVTVLESSTFSAPGNDKHKWFLSLYPHGDATKDNYLSIYLSSVQTTKSKVWAKYKLSILDTIGQPSNIMDSDGGKMKQFVGSEAWGFNRFIKRSDLLYKGYGLLPNDTLTIYCEVSMFLDVINKLQFDPIALPESINSNLSKDWEEMFESGRFSDVTLVAKGDNSGEKSVEFKAHKLVLSARSPVFAAMFEHELEEQKTNRVEITDVEADVLREMLKFVYSGKTNALEIMAGDLLAVADKYVVESLKSLCEETLCSSLSVENAAEVLILADRHSAKQLTDRATKFININAKGVLKTEGWKTLIQFHPKLLAGAWVALFDNSIDTHAPPPSKRVRFQHNPN